MFCSSAILILRVSSVAVGHPRISQRQPREGVFLANLHVRAPVVESGVIAPQRIHLSMEFPQHVLAKKPHSAWPPPDSDWREVSTLLTISACCILRSQVGSCAHPPLDCQEQILQILDCRRAYSLSHISHPPWLLTSTLCDLFPGTSLCTHPSPACTYVTASFPPTWLCAHPTQSNAIHQNGACGVFVAISFWRKAPTLEGRLTKSQYVLRGERGWNISPVKFRRRATLKLQELPETDQILWVPPKPSRYKQQGWLRNTQTSQATWIDKAELLWRELNN